MKILWLLITWAIMGTGTILTFKVVNNESFLMAVFLSMAIILIGVFQSLHICSSSERTLL